MAMPNPCGEIDTGPHERVVGDGRQHADVLHAVVAAGPGTGRDGLLAVPQEAANRRLGINRLLRVEPTAAVVHLPPRWAGSSVSTGAGNDRLR